MPNTVARLWSEKDKASEIFERLEFAHDAQNIPVTLYQSEDRRKWCVEALFLNETEKSIREILTNELGNACSLEFELEVLKDEDWIAKGLENLSPVCAGRFFIHGTHDSEKVPCNSIPIQIDAAQAFGTGHHGTTAGCLLGIDWLLKRRKFNSCLDLGTGSGILAIAIARLAKIHVIATDIDPVAVQIARQNSAINQVQSLVRAYCVDGLGQRLILENGPYDIIVANILVNPLVMMAGGISRNLDRNGTLILSGLLESDGPKIISAYAHYGLKLVKKSCLEGWLTLILTNGRAP